MVEALRHAEVEGWRNFLLQTDVQAIVHIVNGSQHSPWQLQAVVSDILLLMFNLHVSGICYIPRTVNSKAHQLAAFGRTSGFSMLCTLDDLESSSSPLAQFFYQMKFYLLKEKTSKNLDVIILGWNNLQVSLHTVTCILCYFLIIFLFDSFCDSS